MSKAAVIAEEEAAKQRSSSGPVQVALLHLFLELGPGAAPPHQPLSDAGPRLLPLLLPYPALARVCSGVDEEGREGGDVDGGDAGVEGRPGPRAPPGLPLGSALGRW